YFLYCSPHPHHLHSFPTRRSSDLSVGCPLLHVPCLTVNDCVKKSYVNETTSKTPQNPAFMQVFAHTTSRRLGNPIAIDLDVTLRSEEHTSELQSRGHLVCRLLLEK